MISIVMPVFNAERWLPETLEAIVAQTHTDWELVAVNDGSTDRSVELLEQFRAERPDRVRVVTVNNSGPSRARNVGLELAKGDLIALLDADDVWERDKLTAQSAWLDARPKAIACTCDYDIFHGTVDNRSRRVRFDWSDGAVRRWALLEGTGPGMCSTMLMRADLVHELRGFNTEICSSEDTEFALRAVALGDIGNVEQVLMH